MEDTVTIQERLVWIHREAIALAEATDLVQLKYQLKSMADQVEQAHAAVKGELVSLRKRRRGNDTCSACHG